MQRATADARLLERSKESNASRHRESASRPILIGYAGANAEVGVGFVVGVLTAVLAGVSVGLLIDVGEETGASVGAGVDTGVFVGVGVAIRARPEAA